MHELSIAQSIVEMVGEGAGDARVRKLTLVIGRLSGVMPDAVHFCFDICTEGTVLEGRFFEMCVCGAIGFDCIAGDELRIKQMETA